MRKFVVSAFLAGAAFVATAPAQAVQFFTGGSGLITNQIKAFSDDSHPTIGTTVFGKTESGNELVQFTGNTTLQITGGSGFAQISDGDPNTGDWNRLTIQFDKANYGFKGFEFSVQFNNSDVSNQNPGTLGVTVNLMDGTVQNFSQGGFRNSGNTGFYLLTQGDEVIKSIVLSSAPDRFFQFKQAEVGVIVAPPPVPEPATWAMMIGGLGLVGAAMRKRSSKVQFA
jgi:hypothetical protein